MTRPAAYRVVGHARGLKCPRCRKAAYCDDCALCEACDFCAPLTGLDQPDDPAPLLTCAECGRSESHARTCSVTLRAARN